MGAGRLSDVNSVVHGRIMFHSRVRIVYKKKYFKIIFRQFERVIPIVLLANLIFNTFD